MKQFPGEVNLYFLLLFQENCMTIPFIPKLCTGKYLNLIFLLQQFF